MKLSLCMPVWGRRELTAILLRHLRVTFGAVEAVECQCVVIGSDDDTLALAESLGFVALRAPNVLGSKYNDGHEWAFRNGYDVSFQVNSDQCFDPRLLERIAAAGTTGRLIQTRWLTAIHRDGRRAITTWNPIWSMKAYPTSLLAANPRPCPEHLDRMCDTGTHDGVVLANPDLDPEQDVEEIVLHPLETVQFESPTQLTPWSRHVMVALTTQRLEIKPPWDLIAEVHGKNLVKELREFYRA